MFLVSQESTPQLQISSRNDLCPPCRTQLLNLFLQIIGYFLRFIAFYRGLLRNFHKSHRAGTSGLLPPLQRQHFSLETGEQFLPVSRGMVSNTGSATGAWSYQIRGIRARSAENLTSGTNLDLCASATDSSMAKEQILNHYPETLSDFFSGCLQPGESLQQRP